MHRINLEQGTTAWVQWRSGGIGASDAPSIMGVGFVDAETLFKEKLGAEKREVTFAMRRGTRKESVALAMFVEEYGIPMQPGCGQHDELAWMRASFDGVSMLGNKIAEIKAPGVVDHEVALAGCVPQKYWPQVQHQLFVSGAEVCYYVSYTQAKRFGGEPQIKALAVEPDAEYLAKLLEAEEAFWERLQTARRRKSA